MFSSLWAWVSLFLTTTLCVQQSYHFIGPALRVFEPMTDEVKARIAPSQPLDFAIYDDDDVEIDPAVFIDSAPEQAPYRLESGNYAAQKPVGRPIETCWTRHAYLDSVDRIAVCVRSTISSVLAFFRTVVSRILPTRASISGAGVWTFRAPFHYSMVTSVMLAAISIYFNSQFAHFLKLRRAARRSQGRRAAEAAQELEAYKIWRLRRVMQSFAVGWLGSVLTWAIVGLILLCVASVRFKRHPTVHAEESMFDLGWRFLSALFNVAGYVIGWEWIREWSMKAGAMCLLGLMWKLSQWFESNFGCSMGCCVRGRKPSVRATRAAAPMSDAFDDEKSPHPIPIADLVDDAKEVGPLALEAPVPLAPPKHEPAAKPPSLGRPVSLVHFTEDEDADPVPPHPQDPRAILMSGPSKMLLRSKSKEMYMSRDAQAHHQEWRLNHERSRDNKLRQEGLIGRPA